MAFWGDKVGKPSQRDRECRTLYERGSGSWSRCAWAWMSLYTKTLRRRRSSRRYVVRSLPCHQWKLLVLAHRGGTCLRCGGEAGLSTILVPQSPNWELQHAVVQPSRGSLLDKIQASTSWLGRLSGNGVLSSVNRCHSLAFVCTYCVPTQTNKASSHRAYR
jgi:hypothetical protein